MAKAILSISDSLNGEYTPLPCPSEGGYECVPHRLVKADRNAMGNLIKKTIAVKRAITVKWNALGHDDFRRVMERTDGESFYLDYFDLQTGDWRKGRFYRGDDLSVSGSPPFIVDRSASDDPDYEGIGVFAYYTVSMSFEEY